MSVSEPGQFTILLTSWDRGEPDALRRLLELALNDLRRLARFHLARQRRNHTLEPGALVNELYLRLTTGARIPAFKDREHFFAFASRLMRLILVDYARARGAEKRQGTYEHIPLEATGDLAGGGDEVDLTALRIALDELGRQSPRARRVVELRYLLGLELGEVADALATSRATVNREWAAARAWLYARLKGRDAG
jgi:RNA polymerase sigma factor (TIGR02999 family)